VGSRNSTYRFQQQQLKTKYKSAKTRNKNNKKKDKKQKLEKLYKESDIYFWAKEVRMAFNYRCVYCNTNRRLSAHHIFPKARFPGLKFNLNNGLLLCKKCHDELHKLNDITIKR
jgi:5-methylcytosine-specific restriction endonuclease McrA